VERLASRGAGVTVASSGLSLAIQITATIVLARLLVPADFGLVAMVTTFSLLLTNFGLNGFTEAILQREELDHKLASNIFWICLGAGLFLTLGFASAASLLARLYHNSLVEPVAVGTSITIFITGSSVVHLALLKRAMRFSWLSANDICSRFVSVGVSILLGWAGYGYWALVAGTVAQASIQTIGSWVLCRWVPGPPRRGVPGMVPMVRFAINVYARFTFNYLGRNTDNLLVGWRFGSQTLGFYKKAYDLFALSASQLTAPLTNVAVSALSRFEPNSLPYKQLLLNALAVTALVGMGVGANLTLVGKDVIYVLLGPNWSPAGRMLTFFGPGIGIMLLYQTHGWIHLSIGEANRWFRWGIIEYAFTSLLFVLGLHWGPEGVAVAWTVSFWILTIPALWYAVRPIQLGITEVVAAIWKYVLASLVAAGVTAVVMGSLPSLESASGMGVALARIAVSSLVFLTLYLSSIILLHRGLAPLHLIAGLLQEMALGGKRAYPSAADIAIGGTETPGTLNSRGSSGKPLVSILIPSFNAQEWIADTLRSAIAQTWERKEIIVVDDGSTDATLAIARGFESDIVRVVTQRNQGAAAARNKAISLSEGDYLQFLDADDLLAPDKIAIQMDAVKEVGGKRTLLSSAFGVFQYRHRRAKFVPTELWHDCSPFEWLLCKMGQNTYMQTATWLVSRELAEAAGPWDIRLLSDDDGEYFCRILLASDGVRFVPEAKVYYRGPGLAFGNLSHIGSSTRKLHALWLSMQLHIGYLRSLEDSERVRTACLRYIQTSLIYFYPEQPEIVEQAEQMARDMGGELTPPRLSWKYFWIRTLFGWRLAKLGQRLLLGLRWKLGRSWDKALYRLEHRPSVLDMHNEHRSQTSGTGADATTFSSDELRNGSQTAAMKCANPTSLTDSVSRLTSTVYERKDQ
jgi:O-antigen/teichoic acid export membrane protein/glycosyltransferase involved in cell wall biosynthesis